MAKIFYYGELREITGKREEVLNTGSIKDCLHLINKIYGKEAYQEAKRSLITVNGVGVLSINNFKTKCCQEDEIRFLPICGGG